MTKSHPLTPKPTEDLYSLWINEGWKSGYRHSFDLAVAWGYQQAQKEKDSTVIR
jgi:hypothetical protein